MLEQKHSDKNKDKGNKPPQVLQGFQKLREKVCESMMQIYAAREIQRDARRAEAAARKAAMHLKRLEGNAEAIAQQEENTRRLETEKAERKAAVTIREKKDKKL